MSSIDAVANELGYPLPAITKNGEARLSAVIAGAAISPEPTSLVSYTAGGRLLVIGESRRAAAAVEKLGGSVECTMLITSGSDAHSETQAADLTNGGNNPTGQNGQARQIFAKPVRVAGHLGAFAVDVQAGEEAVALAPSLLTAHKHYDMVLDLDEPAQITSEIPPPGYYPVGGDAGALAAALAAIPEMIGEFEKPRYFQYNPDICAHGASGLEGCRRCIDACPTGAISSVKEKVEVDPYLCQGGGSCATACPSGAITYAFPPARNMVDGLRSLLSGFREAGGSDPVVLIHDVEAGQEWMRDHAGILLEQTLPWQVEEVGSVGIDTCLALVAYGASRVVIFTPSSLASSVRDTLEAQVSIAHTMITGLGYEGAHITLADEGGVADACALAPPPAIKTAASFAGTEEKRTTIRLAMEHLYEFAPAKVAEVTLPRDAPFGEIQVDKPKCTLCMACASVCPARAVQAGGDTPALRFVEWNCLQCGLCEKACPEDAISLSARFIYDPERRRETRTLNEDVPFHCIGCGKAFATTSVIGRMEEKLAGHWMFQEPQAVARLKMCEDCRVKDMFKDGGGLLDPHH